MASSIAATSTHRHFHHSVVVVVGGKVVGTGSNTTVIHAEFAAIANAFRTVQSVYRAKVWSFRVTKTGKLSSAKPCAACHAYLKSLGVDTVYYSDSEGAIQKMRLR